MRAFSVVMCAAYVALVAVAAPAAAQTRRVAVDVVTAADGVKGSTPRRESGVWIDVFAAVRVAEGLEMLARPVVSRRTFDGSWQKQSYQLEMRYERPPASSGGVGLRLEAGQMPSPIGMGVLENRADMNPVVSQHSAYYMPLPRTAFDTPRTYLIAGAYPVGAQATLSSRRWDARAAVIDSSPVRGRTLFDAHGQPHLLNVVAGAGVTPRIGLRFGGAVAHGAYVAASELSDGDGHDRNATLLQGEGEWSFGYTRIVGEIVAGRLETARADSRTMGAWIEVTQTLHPRLFLAARADTQHVDFEPPDAPGFKRESYHRYEAVAGIRLTPDVTLRAGYMVRKGYVVFHWDDQFIASVVFQRKLW